MTKTQIEKLNIVARNLELKDWVRAGHIVIVDVYYDPTDHCCYQVGKNESQDMYRETGPCGASEIKQYGEWKKF